MRKLIKIVALVHIIILCCLISGSYSNNILTFNGTYPDVQSDSDKNHFSFVASNLYCPSANNIEIKNSLIKLLPSVRYNHQFSFLIKNRVVELFKANAYSKYFNYASFIIVRLEPFDIIYPFSYFW